MDLPSLDPEGRRPDLDRPPRPDEGVIDSVDLTHRMFGARDEHGQPCQTCGAFVAWNREHVLAMVQLHDVPSGYLRPMFCDASCWAAWASSSY